MYLCEGQKWDLEHEVRKRDWEVLPNLKNNAKNTKKNQSKKIFTKDLICLRHETTKKKNTKQKTLFLFTHIFF